MALSNRSNPLINSRRLAILLASTALVAGPAAAATYNVTDEASLIAAINAANASAGSDTIVLSNAITLTGALPTITDLTTLNTGAYALTGISGDVVGFSGNGNVSLISGGTITGGNRAILVNGSGGFTVDNAAGGSISGTTQAIQSTGLGATTINNGGDITNGIISTGGGNLTIDNAASGNIVRVVFGSAIDLSNGGALTLTNAGDVVGSGWGIVGRSANDNVTNSGRIASGTISGNTITSGGNQGVLLSAGGSVTNLSGSQVLGTTAIQAGGVTNVTNAGSITGGTGQFNRGVYFTAAGSSLDNQAGGTITGGRGVQASGAATITNAGTITSNCASTSFQCTAIVLFNGGTVTNAATGVITSSGRGIVGTGSATTVINDGSINSTLANDTAVILFGGGSITNNASGTIANANGYGAYIFSTAGSIINAGSITGQFGASIDSTSGTITNSGSIIGSNTGVAGYNAMLGLTNSGQISGGTYGVFGNTGATNVTNLSGGTISSSGGAGVYTNAGPLTVDNQAGASINAGSHAIRSGGAATITNAGTLSSTNADAVWSGGALNLTNSGTITGGFAGVTATTGGTIVNSGDIEGLSSASGNSYAVQFTGAGSITNQSGGTLGGADGAIAMFGSGAITVDLQSGSTAKGNIVSTGDGPRTLTVNGVFNGSYSSGGAGVDTLTLGQAGAMAGASFGAGDDLFTTQGGTITGVLDGGDGTDLITANFASGVSSSLNLANVTGFETLSKLGLGTLTLAGTPATPAIAILAGNGGNDDGLVIFDGTSGLTGDIFVNGAIIRANTAGAFGTGTIHSIDPTIQYAATGTYSNNILLAVPAPASSDPTRLEALNSAVATLTGAITSDPAADPNQYLTIGGNGTIVLTNTANAWTGVTTIDSGATLQGATDTISGGSITDNGTLAFVQPASGTEAKDISGSGSGNVNVSGLGAGNALTFSGTNNVNKFDVLDGSALVLSGSNTVSENVTLGGAGASLTITPTGSLVSNFLVGVAGYGAGNIVNNQGSITGAALFGVALYSGGTVINGSASNGTALIEAGAIGAYSGDASLTGDNYGIIRGINADGIAAGDLTVTNHAGGQIIGQGDADNSNSFGAQASGTLSLDNAGQIVGRTAGVHADGAIDVTNSGLIGSGYLSGTTFTYSDGNDGVQALNGGTINNLAGGQILGSISGIYTTGGALSVTNAGLINGANANGNGGFGIYTVGAGLTLDNLAGATVNGVTNGIADLTGNGLAITNAGTISGDTAIFNQSNGATINNLAGGQLNGVTQAIVSNAAVTLTNAGTIIASNGAGVLTLGALTLDNSGTIRTNSSSSVDGVTVFNNAAATINNSGTISAATASAIAVTGASTITNSGTLAGGTDATFGYGAQFAAGSSGSLVNQSGGTIGGGAGSVLVATDNAVSIDLQAGSIANGAILSTGAGARTVNIAGTLSGIYNAVSGTGIDTLTLASTGSFSGGALGGGDDAFTTLSGALAGTLDGGAGIDSITFNNSNDVSYIGFTNFETGTKLGSGHVTLTGASSIAAMAINAGRLDVNGSLASAVTVGNGGTLGGAGQVTGSVTINAGGILSPGGTVPAIGATAIHTQFVPPPTYGTFTVNGPLTFNAGSFYDVDIDPTQSDHTIVNGSTTLNGGTVRVNAADGTYNPLTIYTIIQSSGGVTGQFAGVTDNLAYLDTSLTYTTNTVNLEARRNNIIFSAVADNPNQAAVADAVQSIGSGTLYDKILVQTADGARTAYDALSGEVYASTQTAILSERDRLQDAMASNRLRTDGMGLWLDAGRSGGVYDPSASRGTAAASTTTNDLLGGFNLTRGALALTVAGGRVIDKLKVEDRASHAKAKSWLFGGQLAYGADLGLHAVVGGNYAWHKVATNRAVLFPGLAESEASTRNGNGYHLFGQAGYASQMMGIVIEPFVGIARDHLRLNGVAEAGGIAALNVRSSSRGLTTTQLGLKLATTAHLGWGTFTPRTSIAWQHVMGDRNGRLDAGFQAGGTDYSILGTALARDAAKVGLDFDFDFGAAKVVAGYTGTLAGVATQHTAKVELQVKF